MTPTRQSLICLVLLTGLAILVPVMPWASWLPALWLVCVGAFAGAALIDGRRVCRQPHLKVSRTIRPSLAVTAWTRGTIQMENQGAAALGLSVCDCIPYDFHYRRMPVDLTLPPGRSATLTYRIYPTRRGTFVFSGVDVAVTSPLRLWRRKYFFPCEATVRVFPNFRQISRYILLALSHQLNRMGIRAIRYKGRGGEFHQLRDFRQGDPLSRIDWKATSRMGRLISREFQTERDQQIIFLLDCGRRMRHAETGRTFFDQALNALLLLAHVAVRQGDAAGVFTFGGHDRWIPPLKREDAIRQLLDHTFDLHATTAAADYVTAAGRLMALQRRRALVILLTNSRAEDQNDVRQGASLLARRHLVIVADLRESILDKTLDDPIEKIDGALRHLALQDYLNQRTAQQNNLNRRGIQTLDVTADRLPAALVNRYLNIKNSGRL